MFRIQRRPDLCQDLRGKCRSQWEERGRYLAHQERVRNASFSELGLEGLVGLAWEMERGKAQEISY